jgi:hypothetical protein
MRRITALLVALPAILAAAPAGDRAQGATGTTERAPGLQKAAFGTPEGRVTVHFPDDMRAGDTLSGVVLAEPEGDSEKKRQKSQDRLSGLVVEMEGQRARVSEGRARWSIPAGAGTVLRLLDSKGKELARTAVPFQPPPPHEFARLPGVMEDAHGLVQTLKPVPGPGAAPKTPPTPVSPDDFRLPNGGQTGRSVTCDGPFDGDLATTAVSLGGKPVRLLAESPRKLVFESPLSVTGPAVLRLRERDVESSVTYRSLAVALAAPTTQLTRGQTTTLSITVSGLAGLSEEVPLELQKSGAVSMSGGDEQVITIKPSDVEPTGSCAFERSLTGLQAGGFGVVATLKVPETVIRLTEPPSGATLREARPRFSWTAEHAPAGLSYAVKIVEGPPGSLLSEALLGAPHCTGRDLSSASWVYPADAPPLRPGASYAVVVKGVRDGAVVALSGPGGFLFRPDDDPCAKLRQRIAELEQALAQERSRDFAGDVEKAGLEAEQCRGELAKAREALAAAERNASAWAINQRTAENRASAARAAQRRDEARSRVAELEAGCAAAAARQAELERARAARPDTLAGLERELQQLRDQLAECERLQRQAAATRAEQEAQKEADRAHEEAQRTQAELARVKAIQHYQHLLDNIQKLGLRDAKDYAEYEKDFRGLWDDLPGVLAVMHGFAAEDVAGGLIPSDTVTAVGQLVALAVQFVDPCNVAAAWPRLLPKIQLEINPETGGRYLDIEAQKKLEGMCGVLEALQKIAAGGGRR